MNDYVSVSDAKAATGMRLVVTRGVPNPWGEAAKGLLHVKRIAHLRVAQEAGGENLELVRWTGINSGPVAIWNDEPPRAGWAEILMLAERVSPEPALIPADERDRACMFGYLHEICGEDGFGWNRRLLHFRALPREHADAGLTRMRGKYDHGSEIAHCRDRIRAVLKLLSDRLRSQQRAGSRYYIGNRLTALDIHAACFMAMVQPLPIGLCPCDPALHDGYHLKDKELLAAADPLLLLHRDAIYAEWLELPMRL